MSCGRYFETFSMQKKKESRHENRMFKQMHFYLVLFFIFSLFNVVDLTAVYNQNLHEIFQIDMVIAMNFMVYEKEPKIKYNKKVFQYLLAI